MKKNVDTLLVNARIYTLDSANGMAEAIAIDQGRIVAVGESSLLSNKFAPKTIIDARGKFLFPGFIDAHSHFFGLAIGLQWVDLVGCTSFEEVLHRLKIADSLKNLDWLVGRGWDQNLWEHKVFPSNERLNTLFPEKPVVLVRVDGHALLANQAALDIAGLSTIHRFSQGEVEMKEGRLTGILREKAADHLRALIPKPDDKRTSELLQEAEKQCFAVGLTGITDAGLDNHSLHLLDALFSENSLKIHLYAMVEPSLDNIEEFVKKRPYCTERLHICSIKLYADGSLGSRTALLKRTYSDAPGTIGIQVSSPDVVREICKLAYDYDYQVNTHCIGDSAVKIILGIYGEFLGGKNDRRWRVEHAQVVDPADLILFGKYAIIPSVQATHATSDMYWAPDRLGSTRIRWAYAYHDLLQQNGWLANGTDFPIERISPLLTFYAAVARKDLRGFPSVGFQMENALSREEALKSITLWAAKANRDEQDQGSLEPGKWADMVLLDQNIMEIPLEKIPFVQVLQTFSHGEKVFEFLGK